ncbi:hypothetical protein [uncultured Photobacterium sp.]|uniref:hypothetical protein n=1 Tax=uncultured Photobacterium sp. TaxID=173973 RepID=UPI00260F6FED|nr:hypothetical protein [uncultured Photobacterium sp.]
MAKSLCKYSRVEIADKFAIISKIVSEPRFVCSSCARAASDKAYLCKPSALRVKAMNKAESAVAPDKQKHKLGEHVVITPAAQAHLAAIDVIEHEDVVSKPTVTKKQAKQLKKLAKKKLKRLKKAAKAVQRYDEALQKAKNALRL